METFFSKIKEINYHFLQHALQAFMAPTATSHVHLELMVPIAQVYALQSVLMKIVIINTDA